jgi:catechol 2,3-dioxygenase-like lactoylglutathione lyase family enzyme
MALENVKVISVPVSDQERAKEFYVEKLGVELTRDDDSIPGIR